MKKFNMFTTYRLIYSVSILCIFTVLFSFFAVFSDKATAKKTKRPQLLLATNTFSTSTGLPLAIPDNFPGGTGLLFPVSGLTDTVTAVELNITFGPSHTWVGDLQMTLTEPGGNSHQIIDRTGGSGTGGDSSNALGPYTFTDSTMGDWWGEAATAGDNDNIPTGSYRTSDGSGAFTNMNPVFNGPALTENSDIFKDSSSKRVFNEFPVDNLGNGTWALGISDNSPGDTGSVSQASITITTLAPTSASASIRGAVLTDGGQAVARARVTITNTDTGEVSVYTTNQFGFFRFEELPVGHFYTMTVDHRQHTFDPQSFTLENDIGDAEFRSNLK